MYCLTNYGIKEKEIKDLYKKNQGIKVKPIITGICKTDIMVFNKELSKEKEIILGHETCARILEDDEFFKKNDIVSIIPFYENDFFGLDINGTLAEYIYVKKENLIKANNLEPKIAAFLEPIAASMSILNLDDLKNKSISIYGNNRISELTFRILKSFDYNVEYLNTNKKYDIIIETMDLSEINIFNYLNKNGTLFLKSRNIFNMKINPNNLINNEFNIKTSKYYDFTKSLIWLEKNSELILDLLGEEYAFCEYKKAFVENNKNKNFIIYN
jgi:threonine dehydrogenase-like Zn-dependent dehydrogenase